MAGVYDHSLWLARIPKLFFTPTWTLPVQGKMSRRHLRVIPVSSFNFVRSPVCASRGLVPIQVEYEIAKWYMGNKGELRKTIRNRRRLLSAVQQTAAAHGLLAQLQSVPAFLAATKIAMYLINDGEIDPIKVMKWCWDNSKQAYVPIVVEEKKNTLLFAKVNAQTEYTENRFGIREPIVEQEQIIQAQSLDLVLMPLVAFDQSGNRLGMGGGFYDTTFAFLKKAPIKKTTQEMTDKPLLIGIAHEIQKVENISAEHWDIPLSTVVTDKCVYTLNRQWNTG